MDAPVDGYDLRTPYQVWRWWIESRKGEAIEQVLGTPDEIAGKRPFGLPLIRFTKFNDFGAFVTGEIRLYCDPMEAGAVKREDCMYRLRRAYVPHAAGHYKPDNPVAIWTRENFDARRLAAHLKAEGIAPDTDWWRADRAKLFSVLPSPLPMLVEHATVVRLDSGECPAMVAAMNAAENGRIDWRTDMYGIGDDVRSKPPGPHAVTVQMTLRIATPTGPATIEAPAAAFEEIVTPILTAADGCEKAREKS
ncbi:hypothetical protein D1610_06080 [Sphingomonas gilva]|uniref:Uncharacterized protein n=1 Tax=Sphingomonas gilva TaxID=2305907 RepID=A0A396RWH9_9SPHN|nr:hypothetical protein D1610_06080 [Sphingomonas gilva]